MAEAVEMMRRTVREALADAYAALLAGHFAEARDATAPHRGTDPTAAVLHAIADAGAGGGRRAAEALDAMADLNPAARHLALDAADLLLRAARPADAVRLLRSAVELRQEDAALWTGLGAALAEDGTAAEMVESFRRAAVLRPAGAAEWSNLAKALAATDANGADEAFRRAEALAPGHPQLRLNRGVALLREGQGEGWAPFRARHALPGHRPAPPGPELRDLRTLRGLPLLLLHDEGFGDTMQFIRFAPLLTARGAVVRVAAPPPLRRLLAGSGLALAETPTGTETWCRIPDLPALFAGQPDAVPPPFPFRHDPAEAARRGATLPPGRRIGLAWAGASRSGDPGAVATDRMRSLSPDRLGPLLAVPGVTWVSLQPGVAPPPGVRNGARTITDWADTAALIAGLDAVVSVDTAVAHLAASMGRKVLLLDRFDHCWRWRRGREDTAWYPGTMRILRQDRPGGWDGVLHRAGGLLRERSWA